jgi:NADP-dependent 3-hydroxy acid dehydrogenase YdfG
MEKWQGKVALVTGASAGIGAATAVALANSGVKVAACARRVDKIEELKSQVTGSGEIFPIQCDLAQEADAMKMFDAIKQKWGGVDICVNNAGLSIGGRLCDGTVAEWRQMLDINVVALCLCSRETVKSIKERNTNLGHIININSLAGHRVAELTRDFNFYSGTKFAVKAITEGLRREMRDDKLNVRVTAISPGMVETEFLQVSMGQEKSDEVYTKIKALQSLDLAQLIVQVLSAPPHMEVNDVILRPTEQRF